MKSFLAEYVWWIVVPVLFFVSGLAIVYWLAGGSQGVSPFDYSLFG